jgi:hypothetical protein
MNLLDVREKPQVPDLDELQDAFMQIMHEGQEVATGELIWFMFGLAEEIRDINERFAKLETEMIERTTPHTP